MSTDATPPILPDSRSVQLPEDLSHCHQLIRELLGTLHERDRKLDQLSHQVEQLRRLLYGPRTEKLNRDQLLLFAEMLQAAPAAPAPPPATDENDHAARKRKGHGRRKLPANLRRRRVDHDLPEDKRICSCCGKPLVKIGETVTEQLEFEPASLLVLEHVRPAYACKECGENVVTESKPPQPIAKGLPGPGLLAHVATMKYHDHTPLYRQERQFERQGFKLHRSTTCDWMAEVARLLTPLYQLMIVSVLQSKVIWTDETRLPMLDKNRDSTRKARIWLYAGDREHPHNVFDFTESRSRDGPQQFLSASDFRGYLQADAFSGYDGIFIDSNGGIIEVGCNAHARRRFYDSRTSDAERAHHALAWYSRLYDIEREAKELGDNERHALRQEKSLPILAAMHDWLREQQRDVLPKSPIGEAITYTLNQWQALCRYTEAGFLTIDNNLSEQEMKRLAIGRNYAEPLIMRSRQDLHFCLRPNLRSHGPPLADYTPHNPDVLLGISLCPWEVYHARRTLSTTPSCPPAPSQSARRALRPLDRTPAPPRVQSQ